VRNKWSDRGKRLDATQRIQRYGGGPGREAWVHRGGRVFGKKKLAWALKTPPMNIVTISGGNGIQVLTDIGACRGKKKAESQGGPPRGDWNDR